jgi:hypothetical protein
MSVSPVGREEGDIQAILQDSGFEEDADLRRSLEELRAFALDGVPQPRSDLQALLTPGVTRLDLRRRNRKRRMGVVLGAAVVGAMGLGAGAVAASEDFRQSVSHAVVKIFEPASQTPAPDTQAAPPSHSGVSVPPAAAVTPSPSATPSGSAAAPKSARPQAAASAKPVPGNAAADHGESPATVPAVPLRPAPLPATPAPATPGANPRPFAGLLPLLPTLPGPVPGKS